MDAVSRRGFMQLLGVSTAVVGLGAACQKPNEKIVPFVRRPDEVTPGNALHFATGYALEGYTAGLLVESHEGHPTKIEGNPSHPDTLGATTAFEQALILGLYDDDRAQQLRRGDKQIAWTTFLSELRTPLRRAGRERRRGPSLPDRTDGVAAAGRSAAPDPGAFPERQVRQLRHRVGRRRRRRDQAGLRPAAGAPPPPDRRVGDRLAGRGLPERRARADPPVARICRPAHAKPRHEPALRRRAGHDRHGHDGGSPPAPARHGRPRLRGGAVRDAVGARGERPRRAGRPGPGQRLLGSEVVGRRRRRPRAKPRPLPRHRGPPPAGGGPRAGCRAELRPRQRRQDRRLRRAVDHRRQQRPAGAARRWSRRSPPAPSKRWSSPPTTRSTAARPTSSWPSC